MIILRLCGSRFPSRTSRPIPRSGAIRSHLESLRVKDKDTSSKIPYNRPHCLWRFFYHLAITKLLNAQKKPR